MLDISAYKEIKNSDLSTNFDVYSTKTRENAVKRFINVIDVVRPVLKALGFNVAVKDGQIEISSLDGTYLGNLDLDYVIYNKNLTLETPQGSLYFASVLDSDKYDNPIIRTQIELGDIDLGFKGSCFKIEITTDDELKPLETSIEYVDSTKDYLKTEVLITPDTMRIALNDAKNPYEDQDENCRSRELFYTTAIDQSNPLQTVYGNWETTETGKESQLTLTRFLGDVPEIFFLNIAQIFSEGEPLKRENLGKRLTHQVPILCEELLGTSRNQTLINYSLEALDEFAPGLKHYILSNSDILASSQGKKANKDIEDLMERFHIHECGINKEIAEDIQKMLLP